MSDKSDVHAFNAGRKFPDWPIPPMPVFEVMVRRVFANLRPVGEPEPQGKPKSGDAAFDEMMARITEGTSPE